MPPRPSSESTSYPGTTGQSADPGPGDAGQLRVADSSVIETPPPPAGAGSRPSARRGLRTNVDLLRPTYKGSRLDGTAGGPLTWGGSAEEWPIGGARRRRLES